jgi:hypothetical protein
MAVPSRRTSHGRASTPPTASALASVAADSQASMTGVVGNGQDDPGNSEP